MGLGIDLFLALVFLGLWLWAQSQPFGASMTALVLYLGVHSLAAILEPSSLLQGILVKAVTSAMEYRRLQERRA